MLVKRRAPALFACKGVSLLLLLFREVANYVPVIKSTRRQTIFDGLFFTFASSSTGLFGTGGFMGGRGEIGGKGGGGSYVPETDQRATQRLRTQTIASTTVSDVGLVLTGSILGTIGTST